MLLQRDDNNRPVAVSYVSKSLTPSQQNYAQNEVEALAALFALETFRPYFWGSHVKLVTDSKCLEYLLKPTSKHSGRQLRWLLRLSQFDIKVEHRAGKQHVVPDLLSRHHAGRSLGPSPRRAIEPLSALHAHSIVDAPAQPAAAQDRLRRRRRTDPGFFVTAAKRARTASIPATSPPVSAGPAADSNLTLAAQDRVPAHRRAPRPPVVLLGDDYKRLFRQRQRTDPTAQRARLALQRCASSCSCRPGRRSHSRRCVRSHWLLDSSNLLHRITPHGPRIVTPSSLVPSVLHHYHGLHGHPGRRRTTKAILSRFWWKGAHRDVSRWLRACLPCKMRKTPRPQRVVPPGTMNSSAPFDLVAIDFVGPLPPADDFRYILTMTCTFTRWVIAVPTRDRSADTVARALLEHLVQHHACPRLLLSDNAKEFIGDGIARFSRLFNIKQIRSQPYTPSTNPFIENWHRWLGSSLTMLTNKFKSDWHLWVPLAVMQYRTSIHATTGVSPFEALYGRKPRLPLDASFDDPPCPDQALPIQDYVRQLTRALRQTHDLIRTRYHDRATASARMAQPLNARARSYNLNDMVMLWNPAGAERLPDFIPQVGKLTDNWSGPFLVCRVHGSGSRRKYSLCDAQRPGIVVTSARADRMTLYEPWYDDAPSIPARPRFSRADRALLNAQHRAGVRPTLPPAVTPGCLVCFPLEQADGSPGFGVARALRRKPDSSWVLHWLGNADESLLGTYQPFWIRPDGSWYPSRTPETVTHAPLTLDDTRTTVTCYGDVGFRLQDDLTLPHTTLARMSAHPKFAWSH